MIDGKTKDKFLKEVEKSGNVYLSCMKMGINRATYYRWKNDDKEFQKKANWAERNGRQNNCDVGEHVLMLLIKDKNLGAVKYLLSHNSPRYKPKRDSKVTLEHVSSGGMKDHKCPTLEDFIDKIAERNKKPDQLQGA